jgi:hypothetical protein
VAHGDDIALVPVRHGYTGVLKSEVRTTGLMGRKSVPAGQFVYGVPTRDISDPKDLGSLTWCAPQVTEGVKLQVSTVCFTSDGVAHYWFPARSSLMVTQFYHGIGYLQVSGLSVQRTSTPFPIPMTLAYVFDQWIRLNGAPGREIIYAQLGVEIRINGVMTPIDHIDIPLSRSQRFCMPFMNGALAFTPVDHAGAPVALPTSFSMPNANVDLFFDEIAANRARVEIVRPPHGVAPLRVSNQSGAPVPDACRPAPLPITLSPPVFAPTAQAAP